MASYALSMLESAEARSMALHLHSCMECQQEYHALGPLTGAVETWRDQALPAANAMWDRLMERIAQAPRQEPVDSSMSVDLPSAQGWAEPAWAEAAPGISCKLLSTDTATDRVSMLVRLAPGVSYPPHRHAGEEELYLLEGELWIEDRKLVPGDYYRAEPGTSDQRVWSETGCMCLLIASPSDELR